MATLKQLLKPPVGGMLQYMTCRGRAAFLGFEFCTRPRVLGRNLSKTQIFGVPFAADPRFLVSF